MVQNNHGFFPVPGVSKMGASASGFAFDIGRPDIQNFYAVKFFNSIAYLYFVYVFIDLEGI